LTDENIADIVIPAKAGIQFLPFEKTMLECRRSSCEEELDYARLLSRALRAIRCANVRSGVLPAQSGFRRND